MTSFERFVNTFTEIEADALSVINNHNRDIVPFNVSDVRDEIEYFLLCPLYACWTEKESMRFYIYKNIMRSYLNEIRVIEKIVNDILDECLLDDDEIV